jgi:hypothetical protein
MPVWESRSNSRRQSTISAACLALGLVLIVTLHDFGPSGSSRHAGFLLGVVLTLIGGATLLVSGPQTTIVDPLQQQIRITDHRLVGTRHHTIPFADIGEVQVAYLQTRSKLVLQYFLQLQLRGGEAYALFPPGRVYAGSSDAAIVAGWKSRLEACLADAGQPPSAS